MNWSEEIRKRFGGFWNTLFLLVVLVVCLRFAGAEWKARELEVRLLYALYLLLAVVAVGIVAAVTKLGVTKLNPPRYATGSSVAADVVWGLKYGMAAGVALVFTVGLLQVDNYLGPLKELIDLVLKKITDKIP